MFLDHDWDYLLMENRINYHHFLEDSLQNEKVNERKLFDILAAIV